MTFRMPRLRDRDFELIYLISHEFSNKEIADILYLSKNTVDTHKRNLFLKMRVSNSAGLVRRAYEIDILPMAKPESLSDFDINGHSRL